MEYVFPVDGAAHSICGLAIGESLGELQDGDERQAPGGECTLAMGREQVGEQGVGEQSAKLIGKPQVAMAFGKGGLCNTQCFGWDWLNWLWAKHTVSPLLTAGTFTEIHSTHVRGTSPAVSKVRVSHIIYR